MHSARESHRDLVSDESGRTLAVSLHEVRLCSLLGSLYVPSDILFESTSKKSSAVPGGSIVSIAAMNSSRL